MVSTLDPRNARKTNALAAVALAAAAFMAGCEGSSSGSPIGAGDVLDARDERGAPVTLRIDAVERDPKDADGDLFLYTVSYRDPQGGDWKPFCRPDRDGKKVAIPLQGYWNASGDYVAAEDVITFGCTSGVVGKCARWGYKPWKTVGGVSLRNHHLACVRMARADYCGDGRSHTREGTRIQIYDRLGIQKREEEAGMVFEAAWGPEGAVYVGKARYAEPLESLVGQCEGRLRGRTRLDTESLDARSVAERYPEALLFNESQVVAESP